MKYKAGDEVLVRGTIERVDMEDTCERPYLFKSKFGFLAWVPESEVELPNKTYIQGLADAWNFAKKLESMPLEELKKVFGVCGFYSVVKQYKIEEALAKIEAYEKEKEIKVKTIVETHDGSHKGVVTLVREKGDFFVLWDNGTSDTYEKHEVKNTGKEAESLDLLLRQIGE